MSFEGSEKRLEIVFAARNRDARGLRNIDRGELDELMKLAQCSIISESHRNGIDAYVLSESSLFVLDDTFILKTCGRTRLLNAVGRLMQCTAAMGLLVQRVKYSRASFLFPSDQHFPHQSFESELAVLNQHFGHLNGSAYVMGDHSHGLRWHLFHASTGKGRGMMQHGSSVEMCLTGLNPDLARRFVRTASFVDAQTTTFQSGIADLCPGATIDDFMFTPCGYSMNGISESEILTVHVTPEDTCSYASVEFACMHPKEIHLEDKIRRVVQIFDPRDVHIAVHFTCDDDMSFSKELNASLPGYISDGLSIQLLSDGSQVLFKANHSLERLDCDRMSNLSQSFSSRSDDVSDCFQMDDSQSCASLDDKPLLSPAIEKRFDVQSLGTVDMESYLRSLIATNELEQTFYVMNLTAVHRLYLNWRQSFPRIEPFYAVKCNPDPVLLRLLASLGAGFDCASKEEIKLVLDMGVAPSRIIFANACKHPADIQAARRYGVPLTTFDTPYELQKIKSGAPHCKALLRIRADDPNARCLLGNKYGAQVSSIPGLFQKAKEMEICIVGISFHVGSGATDPAAFSSAITLARQAFDIGLDYGFPMSVLDIGGGFCAGKDPKGLADFKLVQQGVTEALDRLFPEEQGVKIIAEPGRYFAETCATLACYILGTRDRSTPEGMSLKDYWITDGLYGSFNCILYDHVLPKAIPLKCSSARDEETECYHLSTVFGPTCDGLDTVLVDSTLPSMKPGDWLVFPDMGAYTLAGASNFNGIQATDVRMHYVWADFEGTTDAC